MRKKKSERGRMWEVGGKGGEEMGRGEGEKGGGCCVLAVAREQKRATAKSVAAARNGPTVWTISKLAATT